MKQWMINLILFFTAITAIGISLIRVVPFEITEATYVGIIVTLLGIIATILVGYQIYNAIELKRDIERQRTEFKEEIERQNRKLVFDIEEQKLKVTDMINRLSLQEKALTNLNNESNENIYIALSFLYKHTGKAIARFSALHSCLLYSMYLERDDYTFLFEQLNSSIKEFNLMEIYPGGLELKQEEYYTMEANPFSSEVKLSDVIEGYIREDEQKIRNNKEFKVIALAYNPLMELFNQKTEKLKHPYN